MSSSMHCHSTEQARPHWALSHTDASIICVLQRGQPCEVCTPQRQGELLDLEGLEDEHDDDWDTPAFNGNGMEYAAALTIQLHAASVHPLTFRAPHNMAITLDACLIKYVIMQTWGEKPCPCYWPVCGLSCSFGCVH